MSILELMTKAAVITLIIILASIVGFAAGRYNNNSPIVKAPVTSTSPQKVVTTTSLNQSPNLLFKTQTATFQGTITSVSGRTLSVASDTGQKGDLNLASKVVIYKFPANSATAVSSEDIKTIETGKKVLMNLEILNGKYQVISISYFRN